MAYHPDIPSWVIPGPAGELPPELKLPDPTPAPEPPPPVDPTAEQPVA